MSRIVDFIKQYGPIVIFLLIFFLLDPADKGYLAGYLLTPLIYLKREFILRNLDFDYVILFLFAVIYGLFSIFDPEIHTQTIIFYGIFPPVFYLLGKFLVTKSHTSKQVFVILIGIGILYSLSALITVLIELNKGGFVNYNRELSMFWNNRMRSATLLAAYFTFNMCLPAILLVKGTFRTWASKILAITIFILSLLCVFRLGSRTQLAIFLFTLFGTLFLIMPKQSIGRNTRLIIGIIIFLLLFWLYVPIDLDSQYLSTLGKRLQESDNTGSAGGRTVRWIKSLNNLVTQPLGWDLKEFGYSHNLWLDVAQANGVIPFVLMIIFSVRNINILKKVYFHSERDLHLISVIIAYAIGVNLLFFVEPITQGLFSIFLVYCLIHGATKKYWESLAVHPPESEENPA